jgi:Ca2+/Na+ antiporter|tara:strand:- start:969 stop:1583 length:615 start_codon:yes stop_codon:yes gene_type:complete
MIIDTIRIVSVIILSIVVLLRDIPFKNIYKDPYMQIYLAILCLVILVFLDNITGFVITLALLIIYFRIYNAEIVEKKKVRAQIQEIKDDIKNELNNIPSSKNKKVNCENDVCKLENPAKKNVIKDINTLEDSGGNGPYITQEHLHAAQNNIFNNTYYNDEVGDTSGEFTSQKLYKSQGLNDSNNHLEGYDSSRCYCNLIFESLV